jgi:hypothetical protein
MKNHILLFVAAAFVAAPLGAQEGFEYEVYSTEITPPRTIGFELHTNFLQSEAEDADTENLSAHKGAVRSSFEITRALNPWLDASFYVVAGAFPGRGAEYVGNRLRLTAVAPKGWRLPFDFGISNEVGYARAPFSEHRWMYEFTPILGKAFGAWRITANPALETGFGGVEETEVELEPRARLAYEFGEEASLGLEYYGSLGPVFEREPGYEKHHQLFATVETEVADKWEFGVGLGRGLNHASERTTLNVKIEYQWSGGRDSH